MPLTTGEPFRRVYENENNDKQCGKSIAGVYFKQFESVLFTPFAGFVSS